MKREGEGREGKGERGRGGEEERDSEKGQRKTEKEAEGGM